jgi:hypothetical protein
MLTLDIANGLWAWFCTLPFLLVIALEANSMQALYTVFGIFGY